MAGQRAVTDAHVGNLGKSGLQSGHQLGFEHTVDLVAAIALGHVAADIGIEQQGIDDLVRELAVAADGNIDVQADILIHDAEGHGIGRAVLVADDLLGVEIVNTLILGRIAAEGKALADGLEGVEDGLAEAARKERRLGRGIVLVFAGLGAELDDLALLDDDHALAVIDGDQRTVGNDIVLALGVGRTGGSALPALLHQDILIQRVAVEILAPLIRKHAAHSAADGFNQSHIFFPLFCGSPAYFRMNSTVLF